MSDHEYTPKSKVGKWFNDRLPLLTLGSHLTDYPTPKNLNYWCTSNSSFLVLGNLLSENQELKVGVYH